MLFRCVLAAVLAIAAGACSRSPPPALAAGSAAEEDESEPRWHPVQAGDTLGALAARYGVTVGALAAANGLGPPYTIHIGHRLRLPPEAADRVRTYLVQPGDTLSAIAARFDTTVRALTAMSAISDPDHVRAGQVLLVMPDELAPRPARARPRSRVSTGPALLQPVRGEVVAGFTAGGGGIEIAAEPGAPVRAAADGVVVYAGPGPGDTAAVVMVRHDDGGIGVYARAGEIFVAPGDHVRRGAVIARLPNGSRPRLRFELREGGQTVDPTARLTEPWPEEFDEAAEETRIGPAALDARPRPAVRFRVAATRSQPSHRR